MQFDIITIFPKLVEEIFADSIIGKAVDADKIKINVVDLRNYTDDKRKTIDDRPFGGGPGMLMMVEPIYKCLKDIGVYPDRELNTEVWLTAAGGTSWEQPAAEHAAKHLERIVIICGHYEGVDHRVAENLVDREVSIGNYVLTGGELAAGVLVDSIARLIPGVVGNPESIEDESHTVYEKEYPQYTRPAEFETVEGENWVVPDVLLSGHHEKIAQWRQDQSQ